MYCTYACHYPQTELSRVSNARGGWKLGFEEVTMGGTKFVLEPKPGRLTKRSCDVLADSLPCS